ncbi:MAG: CDP-diacylglycerol--glycerol-3-phosphate 3-phosphatidyltransferase [Candidatus Nanopelagicales bacterium]|jgi:CDP-diacylglycerol---glycerol-3-phosphate 3-phosphatidyltransferase
MEPRREPHVDHVADQATTTSVWNIANALTLVRLLAVPLLVWLLIQQTEVDRNVAAVVFVAASLTDLVDGFVARKYGLITNFGKIADPIADKFLTGVALIGLSALDLLPWWVTGVIVFREVGVTLLRFWVIRRGVISASRGGKAKTLAQTIAITMFLIAPPVTFEYTSVWDGFKFVAMGIAVLLTLWTGAEYVQKALRLRVTANR